MVPGQDLYQAIQQRFADISSLGEAFSRDMSMDYTRLIGHANAMDMILTGRPVDAVEAKAMGLANRVVPRGGALEEALAIAEQIARFPQECLRNDRRSACEQWDLSFDEAMANEARLGRATLKSGETLAGATRFASGHGRGGSFDDI